MRRVFKGYVQIGHYYGEKIEVMAKITLTPLNQQHQKLISINLYVWKIKFEY